MRLTAWLSVVLLLCLSLVGASRPMAARAQDRPAGIPGGAVPATVTAAVDGDKLQVRTEDGSSEVVLLSGIDAPEMNDDGLPVFECYSLEAWERVKELLPRETEVWLEASGDDRDGKDRLLRYVWVPQDGKKAYLLNTKLVREGFAGFSDDHDSPKYFERLQEVEADARDAEDGLWGACGGVHEPGDADETVAAERDTAEGAVDVEEDETGAPGYSPGLGQSRDDWEAVHGEPNPEFSAGLPYYGTGPENHYQVAYWDGNVWTLYGSFPDTPLADAQALTRANIPPDAVFLEEYSKDQFTLVHVFQSASLVDRFGTDEADPWGGEALGTFIIGYNLDGQTGLVFGWFIGTGNNP